MSKNIVPKIEKNDTLSAREKVKRLLGARGMSLMDLTKELNYAYISLQKLLAGERESYLKKQQIADFLGVNLKDLWPETVEAMKRKARIEKIRKGE